MTSSLYQIWVPCGRLNPGLQQTTNSHCHMQKAVRRNRRTALIWKLAPRGSVPERDSVGHGGTGDGRGSEGAHWLADCRLDLTCLHRCRPPACRLPFPAHRTPCVVQPPSISQAGPVPGVRSHPTGSFMRSIMRLRVVQQLGAGHMLSAIARPVGSAAGLQGRSRLDQGSTSKTGPECTRNRFQPGLSPPTQTRHHSPRLHLDTELRREIYHDIRGEPRAPEIAREAICPFKPHD